MRRHYGASVEEASNASRTCKQYRMEGRADGSVIVMKRKREAKSSSGKGRSWISILPIHQTSAFHGSNGPLNSSGSWAFADSGGLHKLDLESCI